MICANLSGLDFTSSGYDSSISTFCILNSGLSNRSTHFPMFFLTIAFLSGVSPSTCAKDSIFSIIWASSPKYEKCQPVFYIFINESLKCLYQCKSLLFFKIFPVIIEVPLQLLNSFGSTTL